MKHRPKSREHELNRREFVRLTLMSSAMLMGPMPALEAAEIKHSASPAHAALRSLAPGAVRPEGWLRGYLEKQAQLCSQLPQISWPFSEAYWAGMEDADAWWEHIQRQEFLKDLGYAKQPLRFSRHLAGLSALPALLLPVERVRIEEHVMDLHPEPARLRVQHLAQQQLSSEFHAHSGATLYSCRSGKPHAPAG